MGKGLYFAELVCHALFANLERGCAMEFRLYRRHDILGSQLNALHKREMDVSFLLRRLQNRHDIWLSYKNRGNPQMFLEHQ